VLNLRRGSTDAYYHGDELYSVLATTDGVGAVQERYDYDDFGVPGFLDAFGNPVAGPATGDVYLFSGRRYDVASRLYYYRTRYLDAPSGRFMSREPFGLWWDTRSLGNGYAYVGNNPASYVDPFGTEGVGLGIQIILDTLFDLTGSSYKPPLDPDPRGARPKDRTRQPIPSRKKCADEDKMREILDEANSLPPIEPIDIDSRLKGFRAVDISA